MKITGVETRRLDVNRYREDGYLTLASVVSAGQLVELRDEAERLVELCLREPDRYAARVEWEGDCVAEGAELEAAHLVRKIEPVSDLSSVFGRLAFNEALIASVTAILGDVELFEDKLNLKLPGGSSFPWHQDWNCCWRAHTDELVTCFLCLDDADETNGCLRVVPRSHAEKHIYPFREGSRFEVDRSAFDEELAVAVPLAAGEVIVFDPYLLHMSRRNRSSVPRRSIIYTYSPARLGKINEQRFPSDFAGAPYV